MRLAFSRWGLAPAAFWAMTPLELAACFAPATAPPPLDRPALERLMARFPDPS
ncbi:MAG: phage tail assembly chaperone [Siculibacillus sp.]|nr:phage tail assembly chaperone [Siculibacillus sp.]